MAPPLPQDLSRRSWSLDGRVSSFIAGEKISILCFPSSFPSDGWDRTVNLMNRSEVCALVELLLDPYDGTIEGFGVEIEKDWCSFGFKFQERISW